MSEDEYSDQNQGLEHKNEVLVSDQKCGNDSLMTGSPCSSTMRKKPCPETPSQLSEMDEAELLLQDDLLEEEDEDDMYTEEDDQDLSDDEDYEEDDYMIVEEEIQEDMNPDYESSPFDPVDTANIIYERQRRRGGSS
jgi:hypothetical protein